ncbi:hypothetical protein OBP_114 [Pseudomonas phage OBP]|uniref:hypothetical protein n=1 Tax=Pseudomonas phage OBP TaxID=1124849 RepID=UPI000240D4A0|nr:hypothetical protein OBP_114 [Pseudomonas phage OBP]AEV89551.1 hypothetical protein OBP_114 [Pseudomonas phage OBP]
MTIDIINVNGRHTKQLVIDAFNKVNGTQVNPDFQQLEFERTGDSNKVMLHNPGSQKGALINKISLSDLFPKTIDLRPFKERTGNLPEYNENAVKLINDRHNTELVHPGKDVLKGRTNILVDDVKMFLLFCRVYGFYELDISEVEIYNFGTSLVITPNQNNQIYTGTLEVLI